MRTSLVVTFVGSDRPGLVEALARVVTEHQGNWERSRMARLAGRFSTINALEGAALTSFNLGLPDDYWSRYASDLRALTEPQLAAASKKFVRPEEVVWLVVGDLRRIEKNVRDLNWGEVTVLAPDGTPLNR